jgi:four helix bundle protein
MLPCERLKAWEYADQLAHAVYDLTKSWPTEERYGLVSQARREAFSVAANICEGASKRGPREFARFLDIALGSLSELTYTLRFAWKRGWITSTTWQQIEPLREHTSAMLWLLYRAIRRSRSNIPRLER